MLLYAPANPAAFLLPSDSKVAGLLCGTEAPTTHGRGSPERLAFLAQETDDRLIIEVFPGLVNAVGLS